MEIKSFFDKDTSTVTHLVVDPATKSCAVIDPVLEYDAATGALKTEAADRLIRYIQDNNLTLEWLLETHIHADHLTASAYIRDRIGGKIAIGEKIKDVLNYWVPFFNTGADTALDASQFDRLLTDGETIKLGSLDINVIHTPGHTPACVSYHVGDAVFVGDTVFMPNLGTARADFPGGDAKTLYESIQKLFALPDETRVFVCHDYPGNNQKPSWETTIKEQKQNNAFIGKGRKKEDFVQKREARDKTLRVPQLLLPSIQFNLRAGKLPPAESNGTHYLKIPVNKLK
ncbi:MAG: MBL fold metallo-hydrolase [Micavibrio sp.]|nr:MAG: MBL fold metallo-hydrolase [Micavibrio sp.]